MANLSKEKILTIMKSQTFGVEIETSGADSEELAYLISHYFNSSVECERYSHDDCGMTCYYALDNNGRKWRCMHDGSLYDSSSDIGHGSSELVTPVLNYDDIPMLQEIVRLLQRNGIKSNSQYGCGVHIHVGADLFKEGGHTVKSLKNLANLMANHQRLLRTAIGFTSSRSGYCGLMCEDFLRRINARSFNGSYEELEYAWYKGYNCYDIPEEADHYNSSRYQMLNYHCLFNKTLIGKGEQATTEFRCFEFHNKMHAGELKAYIQLCLAMVAYSKSVDYVKRQEIETYNNPKNSMKNWLGNMGLTGDEFKTCRRMLTKRLPGDSGRRTPRPHVDVDSIDE